MNNCICGTNKDNFKVLHNDLIYICPTCGRHHNTNDDRIFPPTEHSRTYVGLSPIVKCFFNKLQLQDAPYEIERDAPFIELNVDIAESVCEELLEKGIVDSYSIPDISNIPIIFT